MVEEVKLLIDRFEFILTLLLFTLYLKYSIRMVYTLGTLNLQLLQQDSSKRITSRFALTRSRDAGREGKREEREGSSTRK